MSDYIFLFDLDSTLTRCEILPTVAAAIGRQEEMQRMTEEAMRGDRPFRESFTERVGLLSSLPVEEVSEVVAHTPLNEEMAAFLRENPERCYVVTGNIDCWIEKLLHGLTPEGHLICSHAAVEDGHIRELVTIVDKAEAAARFDGPLVVIGDGDNDVAMAEKAEIVVGYGGVREVAPALRRIADRCFTDEPSCVAYLKTLL